MPGGQEFFYEQNGQKEDADLHDDMLDNKAADEKQRRRAIQNQLEAGLSRDDVEAIFGPIPDDMDTDVDAE